MIKMSNFAEFKNFNELCIFKILLQLLIHNNISCLLIEKLEMNLNMKITCRQLFFYF